MDSITEEPTIQHSIDASPVNEGGFDEVDDGRIDRRYSVDERKPTEFSNDTTNNIILYPFAHQVSWAYQLILSCQP